MIVKAYSWLPGGTPVREQPGTWWQHYRAYAGEVVELVSAETGEPNFFGHPVNLSVRRVPRSVVLEDNMSLREVGE